MEVSGSNFTPNITEVRAVKQAGDNIKVDMNQPEDTFTLTSKKESSLSKEEKQEIVRSARTTAAGWSLFGGLISTLYFGLRSDEKVAEKYNLDANQDKSLIKNIKNQQMLWTLPSMIPGFGLVPGVAAWLYNKNADASKINVN